MLKKNYVLIKIYNLFLFIVFILLTPFLFIKYVFDYLFSKVIYFRKGNIFFKNFLINKPFLKKIKFSDIEIKVFINSYYDSWRTGNFKSFFLKDLIEDSKRNEKIYYYDIGANTGFASIIAAKKLNNKIEAFALEIEPANFKTLCDNILVNNLQNIHPINLGLSDKGKIAKFFYNQYNSIEKKFFYPLSSVGLHSTKFVKGLHNESIFFNILMFSFDDLLKKFDLPQPTHLFVDAYGSEKEIMHGMRNTLKFGKIKKIYLDIEDEHNDIEDTWIYNFLKNEQFIIKEVTEKKHKFSKKNWNAIFKKD